MNTTVDWVPPPLEEEILPPLTQGNNVTAYIKSISVTGEMLIQFNATMLTNFNLTLVNKTNVDIYVVPASERD